MASNCEAHLDALSVLLKYKELIKTSSSNSMIKFNKNVNSVYRIFFLNIETTYLLGNYAGIVITYQFIDIFCC